eukprot:13799380-Ditylum_brightwellii.AAC.1
MDGNGLLLSAAANLIVYNDGMANTIDKTMADIAIQVKSAITLLLAPTGSVLPTRSVLSPNQNEDLTTAISVRGKSTFIAQKGSSVKRIFYTTTTASPQTKDGTVLVISRKSSANISGGSFMGGNAFLNKTFLKFGGRALVVCPNTNTMINGGHFKG